ncbi:MAG TPA: tetratricopeptide repeat protein [Burkholderiales bacterium]|nr:tetratricopeptide repeat protein [Burkholderiales bacterium]
MKVLHWALFLLILIGLLLLVRPDDAITQSFVQRADEFRASIDYGLAADYLRVALARQPWNATLHVKLAEALASQHREVEAQQALAEAERLGADATTVERLRAVWAEKNQRYAEATQHWLHVSERRPLDETAYRHAVATALQAEQWAAARSAAERWITALNSPEAHFTLAELAVFDDPAAAQAEWQSSNNVQAQPFLQALQQSDRTLQLTLLGRAYLAQNDLALAQRAFDEAVAINPGYAEAQAFAGFVRDQRGADGQAWLDRAVELDPNLIVARYFRARYLWERANLDGALDDLRYAAEHDPANALVAAEIGRVYVQRSDFANAEKWLTQARDLKPQDATIWKSLAELYVGRSYGAPDQGVATAQQIVTLAPEDAEAHAWLGRAYLRSGDRGGAERELNEAVRLDPQSALAHFYLGRLFGRETEAGRMEYERAVTLEPEGPIGAATKRVLELP